jgi:hypothetical protein
MALPWLLFLLTPAADEGFTYPPEHRGNLVATFTVAVPEGLGPPRAYYTLTIEGPADLEVEAPQLTDAGGVWSARRLSAWTLEGDRVRWTEEIILDQVKAGIVPLPDVKLVFRERTDQAWQEAEWTNILRDQIELPGPSPPPARTAPFVLPSWAAAGGCVLFVLIVITVLLLRRQRSQEPLSADRRALLELDGLEQSAARSDCESRRLFDQLSDVVRRYVTERFALPAFQQTTAEFMRTISSEPQLTAESRSLRAIFAECDLAKFAGVEADAAQWRRVADDVRTFIRHTATVRAAPIIPATQTTPDRYPGEHDPDSSNSTN